MTNPINTIAFNSYISTDCFIDKSVFDKSANLSIYLDLLNQGALSRITAGMVNAVVDNIFPHINWDELKSYLSYNNSPDTIVFTQDFDGFKNLYSVSELDTKCIPGTMEIIDSITSNPNHHINNDIPVSIGWALFTYLQAYLQDIEAGTVTGSFLSFINKSTAS